MMMRLSLSDAAVESAMLPVNLAASDLCTLLTLSGKPFSGSSAMLTVSEEAKKARKSSASGSGTSPGSEESFVTEKPPFPFSSIDTSFLSVQLNTIAEIALAQGMPKIRIRRLLKELYRAYLQLYMGGEAAACAEEKG